MLLDMLFSFPPRAISSGEGGERRIGSRNPSSNYDFPPSRGKRGRKKKNIAILHRNDQMNEPGTK